MRVAVILLSIVATATAADAQTYRNHPWVRKHCLISSRGIRLAASSSPAALLDSYEREAPGKPLVIFFHGGLVAEDVGISIAKNDLARQAFKPADCYPIFFIWKSEWDKELDSQRGLSASDDLNQPAPDVDDALGSGFGDFERFGFRSIEWLAHTPGAFLWQHMKRDISDAFSSNGAAAEFAQELVRRAPRLGRIVLVGHSAGSLWVLKLMESVRRAEQVGSSPLTVGRTPPPIQFDVILLAPAATYEFVADKLQSWHKLGYQPFRTF